MSVSIGSPVYANDEAALLKTFRQLDSNQRDEVIESLPKPPLSDAAKYAAQVQYINKIASGTPQMRYLHTEADALKWESEIGEDAGNTSITQDIIEHANPGITKSDGLITVTPKNILVPENVPYATFEYDSHEFMQGRPTQVLMFLKNGVVVVKFKRSMGPWMVSFPQSQDKDEFQVDKNICVYISDDV
jgi:hypothetical protein